MSQLLGPHFTNEAAASRFMASVEDPTVRRMLNMTLGQLLTTTVPHETSDGAHVEGRTPESPVDLLFVVVALAEVFQRKDLVVDVLTGKKNPEDDLL